MKKTNCMQSIEQISSWQVFSSIYVQNIFGLLSRPSQQSRSVNLATLFSWACLSNDKPPQIEILNVTITFIMHSAIFSQIGAKTARHPTKCDVINNVKLFPTLYRRIYCRKFWTLSNQTSRY